MAAKIISGDRISRELLQDVTARVAALKARTGRVPGLAVVLVSDAITTD
jgi:5,10-methylene-tetrahydrofolate dehydrogenase/methenyl tetrahydrofolate cyclohydrolase